jgi:hypothetical protein
MKAKAREWTNKQFTAAVGRALRRSARVARKVAKMHGTPVYYSKNGKIIAERR